MKKLLLMLLAIVMAFAMFSCTPEEDKDDDKGNEGTSEDVKLPGSSTDTPITDLPF